VKAAQRVNCIAKSEVEHEPTHCCDMTWLHGNVLFIAVALCDSATIVVRSVLRRVLSCAILAYYMYQRFENDARNKARLDDLGICARRTWSPEKASPALMLFGRSLWQRRGEKTDGTVRYMSHGSRPPGLAAINCVSEARSRRAFRASHCHTKCHGRARPSSGTVDLCNASYV
jgi:hypothetical protein